MTAPTGRHGRPRMVDVGRAADVSAQTVSRYFTGGYVGVEARARIEQAIEDLGYRFNTAARRLRVDRSNAVGIVSMGPQNFGVWSALGGVTEAARAAGMTVVIGQMDIEASDVDFTAALRTALGQLLLAGVDGVILGTPYQGGETTGIEVLGDLPMVVLAERPHRPTNSAHVSSYEAARLAMEHLLELGHQRILHLGGDPETVESEERERGYRDALTDAGLDPLEVQQIDWTSDAGHELGQRVDVSQFTAVFAGNDALALGFLSALRDRGLTAPDDFSIVGIDDMPESRFFAPPLTTVALDFEALGREAFEMLTEIIRTGGVAGQRTIAPTLKVRRSTRSRG